uniref:Interleukin n=1 Tax=Pogona vitticeps TaxID=103695 RepID=A0ABM5GJF0_9SAUR
MHKVVSLCFIALILATAGGTPVTSQSCLQAILLDINMLRAILPDNEGKLYTPKNAWEKCAKPAMECFTKEIIIIQEEHEDNRNITNTIQNIQRNVKACWKGAAGDATKDNECPPCESYRGESYKTFLQYMMNLVQSAAHRRH